MEVTAIQLKNKLEDLWPRLGRNNAFKPWDRRNILPLFSEVEQGLMPAITKAKTFILDKEIEILNLYNVGEVFDCDDFAAFSVALAKLYVKSIGSSLPWAYGIAMGYQFRGMSILHALNIVVTQDDGIYFIDWSDGGRLWKADPENDSVFFISI